AVPGTAAPGAAIDQPRIETLAVGVEAEPPARLERARLVAAAAAQDRFGIGNGGTNGPEDAERARHGLPFLCRKSGRAVVSRRLAKGTVRLRVRRVLGPGPKRAMPYRSRTAAPSNEVDLTGTHEGAARNGE